MIKPEAIIAYILANAPVSHTTLETRAVKKHGMTLAQFDRLMSKVSKHFQISATVKDGEVWYKKRVVRAKAEPKPLILPPYPREDLDLSPFKICFCAMWRADDGEIYNAGIHGHHPQCDAILYPEQWRAQNPHERIRHTIKDNQKTTGGGGVLLEE